MSRPSRDCGLIRFTFEACDAEGTRVGSTGLTRAALGHDCGGTGQEDDGEELHGGCSKGFLVDQTRSVFRGFDGGSMGLDLDGMREWKGGERAALYSLPIAYSWDLFLRFAGFG